MLKIAIFSLESDIHARAIGHNLASRSGVEVYFFASDAFLDRGGLRWSSEDRDLRSIKSYDGKWVSVSDLDVIWWRRVNQTQRQAHTFGEAAEFINNEWRGALSGILFDSFGGTWVNDPAKDAIAGNKLFQLNVAKDLGFKVPRTLISQDPGSVIQFAKEMGGTFVVKKLIGTYHQPLATVELKDTELDAEAIEICPAIYQEKILGTKHLRVNCFGSSIHALLITSKVLDWRRDMSCPIKPYKLDFVTERRTIALVQRSGLEMGIIDMMISDQDEIVWLELNTQGQFLFGEALSGYDLINPFSNFLTEAAGTRGRLIRHPSC